MAMSAPPKPPPTTVNFARAGAATAELVTSDPGGNDPHRREFARIARPRGTYCRGGPARPGARRARGNPPSPPPPPAPGSTPAHAPPPGSRPGTLVAPAREA